MTSLEEHLVTAEFQALDKICLIIDMEGFLIPKFYCRELGAANYLGGYDSHFYEIPMKYTDLLPTQLKQVMYVLRRIHGLPFTPSFFENAKPQDQLKVDMLNMYHFYKTPERSVVAYKGGHIEWDLLKYLDIPSVNLEVYGCPKVIDLLHLGLGYEAWDCGHHQLTNGVHCSVLECQILMEWLTIKKVELRKKIDENSFFVTIKLLQM